MSFFIVGFGGVLGSLSRFILGKYICILARSKSYVGTFAVNVIGAILLGIVSSNLNISRNLYLFLGEGFLGAFTTFSTFMFEGFSLFKDKKIINAIIYIILTMMLGICGYILGINLGEFLIP